MDQASSQFVDRFALEKLVNDKLEKVSHRPKECYVALLREPSALQVTDGLSDRVIVDVTVGSEPSTLVASTRTKESGWSEHYKIVAHEAMEPKGTIVWVHGLYEDNRAIYDFVIGELQHLGYSVYLTTLPYHYERKPRESAFGGEYFFSADLGRSRHAFRQASVELGALYRWFRRTATTPVYVVGFSMGAAVALSIAARSDALSGLCLINPAAGLRDVVWTSPLCRTIRRDLENAGFSEAQTADVLRTFDPSIVAQPVMDRRRIQLIYSLFDQVTAPRQYEELIERWTFARVHRYKAGHLNSLRVPRLAQDIATFFESLATHQTLGSVDWNTP